MEWISVNNEKPKDQEAMLVFDKWDDKVYVRVAVYSETKDVFCDSYDEGHSIDDVEYWMHLPVLPKEDA